jgi:hypothetical protein
MATVSLASAFAKDTHRVRVVTSGTPQAISRMLAGDALNPGTWLVSRLDTLALFTVLTVTKVSSTTYDVTLLEGLAPQLVSHRVSSTTLLSSTGVVIVPPTSADFAGLAESAPISSRPAGGSVDILNAPVPTSDRIGGAFRIVSGDYATQSGVDLYRKLVVRRLTTKPGAFFHLPDYGLGLSLKEPVPMGSAPRLKAEIERQVRLEPETLEVSATVIVAPAGIETVNLRCKVKGQTGPVTLAIPAVVAL